MASSFSSDCRPLAGLQPQPLAGLPPVPPTAQAKNPPPVLPAPPPRAAPPPGKGRAPPTPPPEGPSVAGTPSHDGSRAAQPSVRFLEWEAKSLVINAERQVKPAPPRLSGHVQFKAPPQGCGHDRPCEVALWANELDAQREAVGERTRATYAAGRGKSGFTKTAVVLVPPPATTAYTATDRRECTLPMARPAQPRVERIQLAIKYMQYNRKWLDDEHRVRSKGENAPYDSDLDVLALSQAEWKEVDTALALTKQREKRK
jgi:hypothetical protein